MSVLRGQSARELAAAVRNETLSSLELVETALDRIEATTELNAFITVIGDSARERAREADRAAGRDEDLGPLHGVPVAIKDLRSRKAGVRNTMGLAPLADNVADEDSIVVERLEATGAIIVGTTNTPALGHTIKTENRVAGATPTPFDYDRSAGGSSGGSAAALATGAVQLATGSDIGGSLRVPAACCNVIGLKPTFGLVPERASNDGFSTHSPFFVGGPMARTPEDVAVFLDVLAGQDSRDPFSVPRRKTDYVNATDRPTDDLAVAYSPNLDLQPIAPAVRETVDDAVADLATAGATVDTVDVSLPPYEELSMAYVEQVGVFFSSFAQQLAEQYEIDFETADVEETVRSTIALGAETDATAERLQNVPRTAAYDGIENVLTDYDVLVTPTLTVPPYSKHLSDGYPTEIDGQSVMGVPTDAMLTWVFNLTGHPAASVPAGLTDDGLPVGLQIVGRRFAETDILSVAAAIERVRPWTGHYPDV
ncbi:amidase [Natronococcus amylolyticus DSM 10524]|uniref:Amidase n=1 Tax=Natronococcus amylolyticus DSM 10524 TaxID=1227497 RepID=L9X6J4_9EURY|nr:amidase [Natronococcus amylolyticus]ELY56218.1 amidase [Natronococcus amylolyticus DSM 10524]